jgi:cysteine desulfurase
MIYADNAATTKTSPAARQAMADAMDNLWGNPSSLHSPGQQAAEALFSARERVARAIGAQPREICFTSGGSEADNQAIVSAAKTGMRKGKKHLITTAIEHHAVLHTMEQLAKEGFDVTYVPVDGSGIVKVQDVEAALREDTALVSVMFANNEIGAIQPIAEIGALCRERKIPFHTDAVQAVGHVPVDVGAQNIDMLSLSGHKFHGPRGVGALYVRRGAPLLTFIHGGAQERGFRAGTENLPAILGMAAALDESCVHMAEHDAYVSGLRDALIEKLSAIPHAALNGDRVKRLPGNVSFCFEGIEGESLLLLLDDKGVAASSGSACTSGSLDPSHVLLAIGRPHEVAHGSLRLTLNHENTMEDVNAIAAAVTEVVDYLRTMSPVWKALQRGERSYVIQ